MGRKIVIIDNKTQSQKVIQNSEATTLGELKSEMRSAGISYEGRTFFEGHIRAELKDDASILPTNIPYKGQVVNDLTFLLTAPEKKIQSGMGMTRGELILEAKRLGFQGNPTQAKTTVLVEFIESKKEVKKEKPVTQEVKKEVKKEVVKQEVSSGTPDVVAALNILVDALYDDDTIDGETHEAVKVALSGGVNTPTEKVSKSEIEEMFSGWAK